MLAQDLLIVMRTVLTAAIAMEDTAFRRCLECYRHLQRPDRQIALHAIADCPADHTSRMQVQNEGQVKPTLADPDIADVAAHFWFG